MTLREQLLEMAEPAYRAFIIPQIPGVENVIGIRLPQLRRIAKEITRGDWRGYLATAENDYYEERMLQGMVIGYARCEAAERLELTARFVPRIDNWAVCDSFCARRIPQAEKQAVWAFIQPYFRSEAAYDVRFAVVTGLAEYVDEEHLAALLERLDGIRHTDYYVRMAVAWAVSVCFVKFQEQTRGWLGCCTLDDWTYNKALQKIVESLRVDAAAKQEIRAMKRPAEKRAGRHISAK